MENIQTAIHHAFNARPSEFKNSILDALNDKIQNHVEVKRMELASSIFKDSEVEIASDSEEFQSSSEENVDENF
jgi:hypothetical protein